MISYYPLANVVSAKNRWILIKEQSLYEFIANTSYHLDMKGGTVSIKAAGDEPDINGTIAMTGGTILIHGPTESMNGLLDHTSDST